MQLPECNTIRDIIVSDPELSYVAQFTFNQGLAFLSTPGVFATVFLPVNDAVSAGVFNYTGISTDLNSAQPTSQGSLSMYALFQGTLAPENLTAVPSVNTLLGTFVNEDYVLSVFKDNEGQLFVKGLADNNIARVLEVLPACNGFVYKTDKALLPSNTPILFPTDLASGSIFLNYLVNGSTCSTLLPDAVAALSDWQTGEWMSVWNTTDMLLALRYNTYDLMTMQKRNSRQLLFNFLLRLLYHHHHFLISFSILLPHVAVFSHSLPPYSFLKMKLC